MHRGGYYTYYWKVFVSLEGYCCTVGHACPLFELGELGPRLESQTGE
jgi:hypothetical protein